VLILVWVLLPKFIEFLFFTLVPLLRNPNSQAAFFGVGLSCGDKRIPGPPLWLWFFFFSTCYSCLTSRHATREVVMTVSYYFLIGVFRCVTGRSWEWECPPSFADSTCNLAFFFSNLPYSFCYVRFFFRRMLLSCPLALFALFLPPSFNKRVLWSLNPPGSHGVHNCFDKSLVLCPSPPLYLSVGVLFLDGI